MWKYIKKRIFSLQKDESGMILVFVCVFMVAILVFTLSLLNIGHISNEKIKLQNAADFAALNAATWQARAMNMEGLFNTTVTAGMVLQVARSLVTGVPPDEMPPDWIQLQQSAQDWLQQSFNKGFNPLQEQVLEKGEEFSIDGGFGTDMARLAGALNGNFPTSTYPPRVPLFVYRYRFFDQDHEVNPVVGAEKFVERATKDFDYIPAEPGGTNPYYTSGALPFSQSEPTAPGQKGYVKWEHQIPQVSERIWPAPSDTVRLYSGGPGNLTESGLQYNLIEDLQLQLNPAKQEQMVESLRQAINRVTQRFGEPENQDMPNNIITVIQEYVRQNLVNLTITPDDPEFQKLFVYPPEAQIEFTFPDGNDYWEDASAVSSDSIGQLVIRIFPSVKIGVIPKEARTSLIGDDYELNQPNGQIQPSQLSSSNKVTRWYDTIAKKEFWDLQTTQFEVERIDREWVPPVYEWVPPVYRWVSTITGGSHRVLVRAGYDRLVRAGYWRCDYRVTCPVPSCNYSDTTGWVKNCIWPSNSTCLNLLGYKHQYYSDLQPSERHHREDCVQRKWWYYAFGVEFNITVKAYMNLDFSTLLMAKYTSSTDQKQLERPGNEEILALRPYYSAFQRNIIATCLRPAQDLKFGKNFFRIKPAKIPDDLREYAPDLVDGTVPSAKAHSYAKHLQRAEDGQDITESSDDLFFGMNWYSIPTSAIHVTESIFDE